MIISPFSDCTHFTTGYIQSQFNSNISNDSLIEISGNSNSLAIPQQVHSNVVTWASSPGIYPETDGLLTKTKNLTLSLKVADCVPVFISDFQSQIIGLVHSGWRGTVAGIIPNAIKMMEENGSSVENIHIYLGPSIGECCYEVDVEVAKNFHSESKNSLGNNKWKVSLHNQIEISLLELDIPANQINKSNYCTFESLEFHSYRRDGEKAGRMIATMRIVN
mgnify:CR=1 FL=1